MKKPFAGHEGDREEQFASRQICELMSKSLSYFSTVQRSEK